jgi:hypothetical protein
MRNILKVFGAIIIYVSTLLIFAIPESFINQIPTFILIVFVFGIGIAAFYLIGCLIDSMTFGKRKTQTPTP